MWLLRAYRRKERFMTYISLSMAEMDKKSAAGKNEKGDQEKNKKIFRHPIRSRIIGILRDSKPRTQQELGKILSMSNAAVHYHVKLLLDVGIIKLDSTRDGPNGIVEKLYTVSVEEWPDVSYDDLNYYLDYTVSWMNERHREGINILKSGKISMPFLSGSYSAHARLDEIIEFKSKLESLVNDFFEKCEESESDDAVCFAVTYSILPSQEKAEEDSRHVLEFQPSKI
jgi:DNA-binding Lrp family transcriptional regulator